MNIEQALARIEALELEVKRLNSSTTIAYDVEQAFRTRLGISDLAALETQSTKLANSEDVSINESGASSHVVMDDPDGFLRVLIGGTYYYLPYFSS